MTAISAGAAPTILGNEAQISAEKMVIRLLHDPDIVALQDRIKAELATTPRGRTADGGDRIETAVLQWTAGLIFDEINYASRDNPAFVMGSDTAPRRWFGHTFPGNGKAGDNPDAIYRSTVLDGRGRYEVTGRIDPARPSAQLLFSVFAGTMTHPVAAKETEDTTSNPDAGIFRNLGNLDDTQLDIAADGSFRFLIGGEPQDGVGHLPTEPAPCSFGCRQMLLDWNTPPLRLSIRRLDCQPDAEIDIATVKQSVLADLAGVIGFWSNYPDVWLGGIKANCSAPPGAREGGWGFIGGVHFKLEPGEAAIVTIHPGAAAYMGFQLTDPWMIAPDHGRNFTCLNRAQSVADTDGRYTYVISPVDPGTANWLDTCGMSEGMGLMRWQGFPGGASDNAGLFHDFRIVKLSEVAALEGVARVTPEERSRQIAARKASFFSRFSAI